MTFPRSSEEAKVMKIDPSLDDRGNLCARFKYEVGYLIRLTPKYQFVSDDFEPRTHPLEPLTLNYPEGIDFEDYVVDTMQPLYYKIFEEIETYNDQVSSYLAKFGNSQRYISVDSLCIKCLTHLRYAPRLTSLMTMIVNDPDMINIVKEEGIVLVFDDEESIQA